MHYPELRFTPKKEDYETLNRLYNKENGSETYKSKRFTFIDVPKPGNLFIQVRGPADQLYVKDVDMLMRKNIEYNYYGLEVTHMEDAKIFHKISPGKIQMQFEGSKPTIQFQPVKLPKPYINQEVQYYSLSVTYYLVMSSDPYVIQYYNSCSSFYVSTFYPKEISETHMKDIYEVHKIVDNPYKPKNWITFTPSVDNNSVYYASVFADLKAKPII